LNTNQKLQQQHQYIYTDHLFRITASGWSSKIIVTVVYNIKNDTVVRT